MACRHLVRLATRSPSICTIMDEASSVDDDDDSIAGRCVGHVDDSERALVRDLLASLSPSRARGSSPTTTIICGHNDHAIATRCISKKQVRDDVTRHHLSLLVVVILISQHTHTRSPILLISLILDDVINPTPIIKYIIVIIEQRLVRVRDWLVEGGRCCSLILHRLVLVASCCSLLACLVSLSCLSCVSVRASYLHLLAWRLELGSSLCRCESE